ncbi:MAG: DUF11 domain-containing protein, partial [Cryobacterium sp.]
LVSNAFFGSASDDYGSGIAAEADGNVVMTGWSHATWGSPILGPSGGSDAFVAGLAFWSDLAITKDDGQTTVVPGGQVSYTITVTNLGPADVAGATVTDVFGPELTGVSWTCTPSGGASCTAFGTDNLNDTVDLPEGSSVSYVAICAVDEGASGELVNIASVAAPVETPDPNPGNNSAADTDTLIPLTDLAITKDDGQPTVVPGGQVSYTITVTNLGSADVAGATVTDAFGPELTGVSWTCTPSGGASCTAFGTGNLSDLVDLPAGAQLAYTATGTVSPGATGTLANTTTVDAPATVHDPDTANNTATDSDSLTPQVDLTVTVDDGVCYVLPGASTTYAITVHNLGPSSVSGARVVDAFDPLILDDATVSWTCTGAGCRNPSGAGDIDEEVDLAPGDTVVFAATGAVLAGATGVLENTATVTPPAGVAELDETDNSATDRDALGLSVFSDDFETGTTDRWSFVVS